jgi:hypothetical protein
MISSMISRASLVTESSSQRDIGVLLLVDGRLRTDWAIQEEAGRGQVDRRGQFGGWIQESLLG